MRGTKYPSLKAVATKFGIGLSTLKDRLARQGRPIEEAIAMPLAATSYRRATDDVVVDGLKFRSKRQAILHIARTRGITEHHAKYRLSVGAYD